MKSRKSLRSLYNEGDFSGERDPLVIDAEYTREFREQFRRELKRQARILIIKKIFVLALVIGILISLSTYFFFDL